MFICLLRLCDKASSTYGGGEKDWSKLMLLPAERLKIPSAEDRALHYTPVFLVVFVAVGT